MNSVSLGGEIQAEAQEVQGSARILGWTTGVWSLWGRLVRAIPNEAEKTGQGQVVKGLGGHARDGGLYSKSNGI